MLGVVTLGAGQAFAEPVRTAVVEDSDVGSQRGQVSYAGAWTVCGGYTPATPNRSFRYARYASATAVVRMYGSDVGLYAVKERSGGRMAVSVDGAVGVVVDLYAPTSSVALAFRSGRLAEAEHVVTITVLGERAPESLGTVVGFDRAEVFTDNQPPPSLTRTGTIEDSSVGTQVGQVAYSGTWTVCGGCVPATPNDSFQCSGTGSASATVRFAGTRLDIYAVKEGSGGRMSVSVDGSPPSAVDLYAPSSAVVLAHQSATLPPGEHLATVTNLGERNPSATGTVVGFDRPRCSATRACRRPPATRRASHGCPVRTATRR